MEQNRSCFPFAASMDCCRLNPYMLPFSSQPFKFMSNSTEKNGGCITLTLPIPLCYKVDRHRNTNTHTHIPTQSINFEHSNCLFDVCHNSHAGSGLQMVWKSLRSRNCGVDQYMHGQNFLTTGWFLASSIVYIYCSFTGEFCQLVWQIGVLFVWHWCSPKLFQNLLFKL